MDSQLAAKMSKLPPSALDNHAALELHIWQKNVEGLPYAGRKSLAIADGFP